MADRDEASRRSPTQSQPSTDRHPCLPGRKKRPGECSRHEVALLRRSCEVSGGSLAAAAADSSEAAKAIWSRRCLFVAFCQSDGGEARDAVRWLEAALRLDACDADAWRELVLVYERDLGDLPAARRCVRTSASPAALKKLGWHDEWQRPGYALDQLAARPWWPGDEANWVADLEAFAPVVKEELANQLRASWAPVGGDHRESGTNDSEVAVGDWREVVLVGSSGAVANAAPRTVDFVCRSVPGCAELCALGGGEVIFSRLGPRSRITAHCAPTNLRLTAHLGLEVPSGGDCSLRVAGGPRRPWADSKVLLFDDSFEHDVVNDTDEARVILLIRFFHPSLKLPADREAALDAAIQQKSRADQLRWHCPA